MTFAANIEKASEKVTTLVRIRPRKRLEGWVVNGTYGNVYQFSWEENVVAVYSNSFDSASLATSLANCAATDYSYYYDSTAEILYFNPNGTDNPNTNVTSVEWNWFVASEHLNWYSDPLNSGSGVGIWSGGLIKPAIPTQGNPDLAFGYLPLQITSIEIQFADGEMLEHAYDWSLNKAPIKVWECVGDLAIENISETFTGACGNYTISNGKISIQVADPLKILEEVYEFKTFNQADFPNLDPNAIGKPIRLLYGYLNSLVPTNINYSATPSTTNNRDWVVCDGVLADAATISRPINHLSPNNTATTTQLFDASGLNGGGFSADSIIIYDNGVPKYARIYSVNYSTNIITHDNIGARSPVITDTVQRGSVGSITISVPGFGFFFPLYGRDYIDNNHANGTRGFSFLNNFEANLPGFPSPFDPNNTDFFFCRAYGNKTLPKKLDDVTDFGQVTERGGCYANPVTILWDILRNKLRNFEDFALLDETAWQALATSFDRPCGFAIPNTIDETPRRWKDVILEILKTELLKLHYKIDSGLVKLTISQLKPTTDPFAVDAGEISSNELSNIDFSFSYNDNYEYFFISTYTGEGLPVLTIQGGNNIGKYLHRSGKTFTDFTLYQQEYIDAQTIFDRIRFILSERKGTLTCTLPIQYLTKNVDDFVTVLNDYLPGFKLTGLINQRDYAILQHAKSSNGVTVVLDDQKGIEDNSGDW